MNAEVPSIGCMVITLAAYAADGACCDLRDAEGRHLIKLYVALPKDRIGKNIF